jgi:general secretion pathway protein A
MRDTRVDFTLASPPGRSPYLTYEPYYGLKEKPFSLSADPRFLYKSRTHAPVFDALRAGIRRKEGIIVLTGEPGTGKTTLCRSVLASLDRKTFCAVVPDPFVSREDLLKMLLVEFGVMSLDALKSGRLSAASRPELSYPLYEFLRSLVPLQAYAVLIIDEAQNLAPQVLEEIRILSDLEGPDKLLQLVLVGQPELHDKMKHAAMRQVDQRVSVRCALEGLERDAVPAYIAHRLTTAGAGADRVEFAPAALDLLYSVSNGNPRVINLIADKCLNRGHLAGTWIIPPEIVSAALGDLGYAKPQPVAPAPPAKPTLVLDARFAVARTAPASLSRILSDDAPHFLLEQPSASELEELDAQAAAVAARRRRAAMVIGAAILLAAAGVGMNGWYLQRQDLARSVSWPALPAPPAHPVIARVAPVVPAAHFFASGAP